MTDRLDTIRKHLASGSPFTPHAVDLAWAIGEIDRLITEVKRLEKLAHPMLFIGAEGLVTLADAEGDEAEILAYTRSEIARLDALSRATVDDVEDAVPCLPCGRVECACGLGEDEERCA